MKSAVALARLTAVVLATLVLVAASSAATHPLDSPMGLAVAPNGNLYVANNISNEVLVYSPAHAQLTSKTITAGISALTAVAFDSAGNLWVANAASSSITEYTSAGAQLTGNTITSDISTPYGIVFDGLDDLWVNDQYETLEILLSGDNSPFVTLLGAPALGQAPAIQPFTAIASWGPWILFGNNQDAQVLQIYSVLVSPGGEHAGYTIPETCFAAAFDKLGDLYCANQDESLTYYPAPNFSQGKTLVANMGFYPFGLTIDSSRGLIYVSNADGNSIAVYSTKNGALLTTIK